MALFARFLQRSNRPHPLRLYSSEYCYYCQKVRRAADRLGLTLEIIDTLSNSAARRSLIERRGRATVPVLGIITDEGEELMPESDDIVRFLEEYAEATKARRSEPPPASVMRPLRKF